MTLSSDPASGTGSPGGPRGVPAGARRVMGRGFAAQGAAVAAVFTTVPAVREHLGLSSLMTTALLATVALTAGAGSFAGLAAVRRFGAPRALRAAVLVMAAALLLIGWAPGRTAAIAAYVCFGLAVGAVDVAANTRAAALERHHGHSIFASFYAAWSAAGAVAALLTAGAARLGWPTPATLTLQAAIVLGLALTLRDHALPADPAAGGEPAGGPADAPPGRALWVRLVPFGVVLLVAYVVDSTVSAWSTAYLHQTLRASLSVAPLAYAAYQAGTVAGRAGADRAVRVLGPAAVVRATALLTAAALGLLATAAHWAVAVAAAGVTGLGVSVLAPLCLASAGRLRPGAAEAVLARLNLFNYAGVLAGGAAGGLLGAGGHFRIAYAAPAVLAAALVATAGRFTAPEPVRAAAPAPAYPSAPEPMSPPEPAPPPTPAREPAPPGASEPPPTPAREPGTARVPTPPPAPCPDRSPAPSQAP